MRIGCDSPLLPPGDSAPPICEPEPPRFRSAGIESARHKQPRSHFSIETLQPIGLSVDKKTLDYPRARHAPPQRPESGTAKRVEMTQVGQDSRPTAGPLRIGPRAGAPGSGTRRQRSAGGEERRFPRSRFSCDRAQNHKKSFGLYFRFRLQRIRFAPGLRRKTAKILKKTLPAAGGFSSTPAGCSSRSLKWRPQGDSNPCCRDENPVS